MPFLSPSMGGDKKGHHKESGNMGRDNYIEYLLGCGSDSIVGPQCITDPWAETPTQSLVGT